MIHTRPAVPASSSPRYTRMSLLGTALLLVPATFSGPQHVAEGGGARVTTLWRSEKALDGYAKEGLAIASAVLETMGERPEDAPLVTVGIAESSLALRLLEDPEAEARGKAARRERKRARREAEKAAADDPGVDGGGRAKNNANDAAEPAASTSVLWVVPGLLPADPDVATVGGAVIAMVPKVHDRVMFGTGLTPATRWGVALETARAVDPDGDILGHAQRGMEAAKAGFSMEQEPFLSSGLLSYQQHLRGLRAADVSVDVSADVDASGDAAALAAMDYPTRLSLDALGPVAAPIELVARHYRAAGLSTEQVLSLEPEWFVEAGAVGRHAFGWQAVATRRADALALTAKPRTSEPFRFKASVILLSNDLTVPAQADFVLGDVDGVRYLLACNTSKGVFLFKRAERGGAYESLTEMGNIKVPVGRPVEVEIVWANHTLVVKVGGAAMTGVVLPEDGMTGRFGFGCHAGSSVLFSEMTFE